MAAKKKAAAVEANPVRPFTEIEVNGEKYKMCFTYGALAEAETAMLRRGIDVNLNLCLPRLNFANTRILFAASLLAYHPDIDPRESMNWVTAENNIFIVTSILKAFEANTPKRKSGKSDPPDPDQ